MTSLNLSQQELDEIFPASKADAFFEALYGAAEDGAYDIKLTFLKHDEKSLSMAFELHQRPDKCLACNLTYGLPQVFQRHPIINVPKVVQQITEKLKLNTSDVKWELGKTQEESRSFHYVPLNISY